jgi:hypothetical protein
MQYKSKSKTIEKEMMSAFQRKFNVMAKMTMAKLLVRKYASTRTKIP